MSGKSGNPEVIRPADDPFANHPTIVVLRGSLAPEGSVVKLAVDDTRPRRFSGPARIYHSRDAGLEGLRNGEVQAGEVVLLSGIGLRGGSGMGLTCSSMPSCPAGQAPAGVSTKTGRTLVVFF